MDQNTSEGGTGKKKIIWVPQLLVLLAWYLDTLDPGNLNGVFEIICLGVFSYLSWIAWGEGKPSWAWFLGVLAVACNPFFPVYLGEGGMAWPMISGEAGGYYYSGGTWALIEWVAVGVAVVSVFVLRRSPNQSTVGGINQ